MKNEETDPTRLQLVLAPRPGKSVRPHVAHAALWMLVGAILTSGIPILGACFMAYGAREFMELWRGRGLALAAVEGLALAAAAWFAVEGLAPEVAIETVCVVGIAWCMRDRRATLLGVTLTIAVTACADVAISELLLLGSGTSVVEAAPEALIATLRESAGTGIQENLLVGSLEPALRILWPLQYVTSAAVAAASAGLGVQMMRARISGDPSVARLASFVAPLWTVALLALAAAGFGASYAPIPHGELVRTVCATVAMSVRFIFTTQGLGVMSAFLDRFGTGRVVRTLLTVIAIWVDLLFFIFSIVGLVDVWANFRRLARGAQSSRSAQQ